MEDSRPDPKSRKRKILEGPETVDRPADAKMETQNQDKPPSKRQLKRQRNQQQGNRTNETYKQTEQKSKLYAKYYREMPFLDFESGSTRKVSIRFEFVKHSPNEQISFLRQNGRS